MKWLRKHTGILAIVGFVIIAGLATSTVLLAISKNHSTSQNQVSSQQTVATTQTAPVTYKLGACKSGATQTIGNADYLVGTDIAPGSYKVVSMSGDNGSTGITIYSSKADYNSGNEQAYFDPNNGTTTYTKLNDGQYMEIEFDPATFTCE